MKLSEKINELCLKFNIKPPKMWKDAPKVSHVIEVSKLLSDDGEQWSFLMEALRNFDVHYEKYNLEVDEFLYVLRNLAIKLDAFTVGKHALESAIRDFKALTATADTLESAEPLISLGKAFILLHDHAKAKEMLDKALSIIIDRFFNCPGIQVAEMLYSVGIAFGELGHHDKRKQLIDLALPSITNHYYSQPTKLAMVLATAFADLRNPEEAKATYEVVEDQLVLQDPDLAKQLVKISSAYRALGYAYKKVELLEYALKCFQNCFGDDHKDVYMVMNELAYSHVSNGHLSTAQMHLENVLASDEDIYALEHRQAGMVLMHLGSFYGVLGAIDMKRDTLRKAFRILDKTFAQNSLESAEALIYMASVCKELEARETEAKLLEKATAVLGRHLGPQHIEVVKAKISLSLAYGALENFQKQTELLEFALPIIEEHYGHGHYLLESVRGALEISKNRVHSKSVSCNIS